MVAQVAIAHRGATDQWFNDARCSFYPPGAGTDPTI